MAPKVTGTRHIVNFSEETLEKLGNLEDWPDDIQFSTNQSIVLLGCHAPEHQHIVMTMMRKGIIPEANVLRARKATKSFRADALRAAKPLVEAKLAEFKKKTEKPIVQETKEEEELESTFAESVIQNFTAIQKNFENVESNFNSMLTAYTKLKTEFDVLKTSKAPQNVVDLSTYDERFEQIEGELSGLRKIFANSSTSTIPNLNNRLSELKDKINKVEKDVEGQQNRIGLIQTEQKFIVESICSLQKQVTWILSHIRAKLPGDIKPVILPYSTSPKTVSSVH